MKHRGKSEGRSHFWLPVAFLAVTFACVSANALRVQWFGSDEILEKAEAVDRMWAEDTFAPERGEIVSSDGRILASSVDSVVLGIDAKGQRIPDNPAFWSELGSAVGVSGSELRDYAVRKGAPNDFGFVLTRDQARAVGEVRRRFGASGVWTRAVEMRDYPLGKYAAPIIGHVDAAGRAVVGLERSLADELSGRSGKKKGLTDADGNFIPWHNQVAEDVISGKDVELTIDSELQIGVMNSLAAACERHKATKGTAIVLDPKTGDILALATWPTYEPERIAEAKRNAGRDGTMSPDVNPAVELYFEPGSTFKAFTVALGLDLGAIDEATVMQCSGSKSFSTAAMSCAGDHGGRAHGVVTPARCIEVSCNLAAATWAVQMGFKPFTDMIRGLGLFEKQEIGLPKETVASLYWEDANKTIQTANLGFGQAFNVTPIGLASAFTVFANEGLRVKPRLIKSIDGKEQPTRVAGRVFTPETSNKVLEMMDAVVQGSGGTGKRLKIPGYRLAGKTGTAQKLGSSNLPGSQYVSNFIGYVPADKPRAVVLVMIDEPQQGGYYGGIVAGPVFQDTARLLIRKLRIPPSEGGAVAPR